MGQTMLPDISLVGRVVVMTGADRGLGREMSLGLAQAGATVVLASPAEEGLQSVAEEIQRIGTGRALVRRVDITSLDSCRALVRSTLERAGRFDVLVNNARRLHRGQGASRPLWSANPDYFRETVTVNVIGTFFMSYAAVQHFHGQGGGKIINLTTSTRHFYGAKESPYGVTKAGLEACTQIWARDCEGTGITVNSLLPGASTDTDPDRPGRRRKQLLPGDIMNPLVIWLASEQSDGVTGCRFVASKWDPALPPIRAAWQAREEPVFQGQPLGTFPLPGDIGSSTCPREKR